MKCAQRVHRPWNLGSRQRPLGSWHVLVRLVFPQQRHTPSCLNILNKSLMAADVKRPFWVFGDHRRPAITRFRVAPAAGRTRNNGMQANACRSSVRATLKREAFGGQPRCRSMLCLDGASGLLRSEDFFKREGFLGCLQAKRVFFQFSS